MSNTHFNKRFIDINPSNANPLRYSETQALNTSISVINLTKNPISYKISGEDGQSLKHEVSPLHGEIKGKEHANINIKMAYENLNPNELNEFKFIVEAWAANNEEVQKMNVGIACIPRSTAPGKYNAKIKYDISGSGIHKSFERSQTISISQKAPENGEQGQLTEEQRAEREKELNSEMERLQGLMDKFEDRFNWGKTSRATRAIENNKKEH